MWFNLPNLELQPLPPGLLLQHLLVLLNCSVGELEPEIQRHRPSIGWLVKHHFEDNLIGDSWCKMGQFQLPVDLQPADVLQRRHLDFGISITDVIRLGSEQRDKYV